MARPCLLNPEIVAEAGRLIATALYVETVAGVLGVSRSTFHSWLQRGAKESRRLERKGAKPKASESIYLAFLDAIKKGRGQGEFRDLQTIQAASAVAWQAAAWRLERRFPHRWGNRARIDELERKVKDFIAGKPVNVTSA